MCSASCACFVRVLAFGKFSNLIRLFARNNMGIFQDLGGPCLAAFGTFSPAFHFLYTAQTLLLSCHYTSTLNVCAS